MGVPTPLVLAPEVLTVAGGGAGGWAGAWACMALKGASGSSESISSKRTRAPCRRMCCHEFGMVNFSGYASNGYCNEGHGGERNLAMEVTQTAGEYVQFGCGLCAPLTWRNFDAGPAFWLEKHVPLLKPLLLRRGFPDYPANIAYGDVIKGLPVAQGSAAAVYCSHVLEHLALADLRTTLRNTFGYLRPGGIFRFVLPDLEWLAWSYV